MREQVTRRLLESVNSRIAPFSSASARWLVAAAAVALACGLLGSARDSALEHAGRLEAELTQLDDLAAAYRRLSAEGTDTSGDPHLPRPSVRTIVEHATRQALHRGKVLSLEPRAEEPSSRPAQGPGGAGLATDESVELRLSAILLTDLVDLLYELEHGPHPLRVHRLHVRRSAPQSIDVEGEAGLEIMAVLDLRRASR